MVRRFSFSNAVGMAIASIVTMLGPSNGAEIEGIPRLGNLKRPATTVKQWLSQVEAVVQVTGVKVERTDSSLNIFLDAASTLQVDATKFRTEGNNLIADIPNAVLALPNAQEFIAENPTDEIARVQVTQIDANTIQITVAGNDALPKQDVTLKTGEFSYSLNPSEESDIEVLVTGEGETPYFAPDATTGTRTDTPLRDVPQSVQVIPQQILRDQQVVRLDEALRNVSSVVGGNSPEGSGAVLDISEKCQFGSLTGFQRDIYQRGA